jgi:pimeloyl-ACP methyl ester carboxylesterase
MSALRHGRLAAGGTSTSLIEAGPEEVREAIVFVHGNPGSSSDWTALIAAAGEVGRAVAFDMPGFGSAAAPPGFSYDVSAYADFLDDALRELGIERAHLVLHDFGGPFGLQWGVQHPQSWASVVLINIGVMPGYEWHSMAKRWRTPLLGELVQAWIPRFAWRRAMQGSSPRGLPEEFVEKMYDDYDRDTRQTVLKLYRATPDPGKTSVALGAATVALEMPALVIWGAADPFIDVAYAERQREFFDVQELVILKDSGHWPFQDDPGRVEQALVPFLREQLGAAQGAHPSTSG